MLRLSILFYRYTQVVVIIAFLHQVHRYLGHSVGLFFLHFRLSVRWTVFPERRFQFLIEDTIFNLGILSALNSCRRIERLRRQRWLQILDTNDWINLPPRWKL